MMRTTFYFSHQLMQNFSLENHLQHKKLFLQAFEFTGKFIKGVLADLWFLVLKCGPSQGAGGSCLQMPMFPIENNSVKKLFA